MLLPQELYVVVTLATAVAVNVSGRNTIVSTGDVLARQPPIIHRHCRDGGSFSSSSEPSTVGARRSCAVRGR